MKVIFWIGSVIAELGFLLGLVMLIFGNSIETGRGLSILQSVFSGGLLLTLIKGVMDIREYLKAPTKE